MPPLKETLTKLQSSQNESREARIANWKEVVTGLFDIVETNLRDYIKDGLLKISRRSLSRVEESLGAYEVEELLLIAGPATITFTPVGTQIVGARGRVDVFRSGYADNRYLLIWNGKGKTAAAWQFLRKEEPNQI